MKVFSFLPAWLSHPFSLGYLTTLLVLPGPVGMVTDSSLRLGQAHWLWTGTPLTLGIVGRHGIYQANYGVGQSLLLLPFDVVATYFVRAFPLPVPDPRMRVVSYLFFPLLNGLATWAGYRFARALGFTAKEALLGVVTLLFGSTFLWHCQNNQENHQLLLFSLLGLTAFLRYAAHPQRRWLVLGAVCLGANLLVRLPSLADALALSLVPVVYACRESGKHSLDRVRRYARDYLLAVVPVLLAFGALDRLYHYWRFGTWLDTYQHRWGEALRAQFPTLPESFPFSTPFLEGFLGPFFSPAKSVFLYDPLFALGAITLIFCFKTMSPALCAVGGYVATSLGLTAAAYAKYAVWSSDPAWGHRFTTVPVHTLCLVALPLAWKGVAPHIPPRLRTWVMACVLVLAMGMQFFSILIPAWVEQLQAGNATGYLQRGEPVQGPAQGQYFHLGMRVKNTVASATGRFEAWGLHRTADGKEIGPSPLMLLPFLPLHTLPNAVRWAIRLAWLSGFALLVTGIFWALRPEGAASLCELHFCTK